jgi:bifunctional enzyme CysN/CysC
MAHAIDLAGQDILTYLKTHEHKDLLRFITCGSVDDGKSTLIGRLLYESKLVYEDQLAALAADSKKVGTQGDDLDLALLVDGLAAEREQGITIDVAYRFFSTDKRKFIVADTPGHEQYTRNMVTGASTADLAIILIDARKGVLTQTRRHSYIVSLLGIRHVVLAVNKMDAVGYDQATFDAIVADYRAFAQQVGLAAVTCIPLSALKGENITTRSDKLPWYQGPALMEHLETVTVEDLVLHAPFRLPVQWVNRPNMDFRGFAGQIASGQIAVGDRVRALPSGKEARVARIVTQDGDLPQAQAGQSITLTLDREIDVSRGDLLATAAEPAGVADQFETTLIWMHEQPMLPGRQYLLKTGTRTVNATIATPKYRVNVNTLEQQPAQQLELNEIGVCNVTLDSPVAFDPYAANRETGGFILIDKLSFDTVGAGLLHSATRRAENIHWQALDVNRAARSQLKGQRACALWFTGLSGSGKSTIANLVEKRLHALGRHTYLLDGDNVRHGLNRDLGFTNADRVENIRRVAEVSKLMVDAGLIVLVSFISPFRSERRMAREKLETGEFIEIFIDTTLEEAEKRDPKGLYRKARSGELKNFTGIDSPYEPPEQAEITIRTAELSAEQAAERIIGELDKAGVIAYAYNNPLAGL